MNDNVIWMCKKHHLELVEHLHQKKTKGHLQVCLGVVILGILIIAGMLVALAQVGP